MNGIKRFSLIAFLLSTALVQTGEERQKKMSLKQVAVAASLGTASMLGSFKMIGKGPRYGYLYSAVVIEAATILNCLLNQTLSTHFRERHLKMEVLAGILVCQPPLMALMEVLPAKITIPSALALLAGGIAYGYKKWPSLAAANSELTNALCYEKKS